MTNGYHDFSENTPKFKGGSANSENLEEDK